MSVGKEICTAVFIDSVKETTAMYKIELLGGILFCMGMVKHSYWPVLCLYQIGSSMS